MAITYQKANATVKKFLRDHPNELHFLKRFQFKGYTRIQRLYNTFMRRCIRNIVIVIINLVYKTNLWST